MTSPDVKPSTDATKTRAAPYIPAISPIMALDLQLPSLNRLIEQINEIRKAVNRLNGYTP